MAKPRNKYVDYLVYLLARTAAMFVHMAWLDGLYALAALAGDLLWLVDRRHRRIALEHVRLSFPHWPQERVRRCARASIRSLAMLGIELLLTPRLIRPNRWKRHVRLANMGQLIRLLLERRGLILLTGHLGNWEVAGYVMATLGFPSVSVARPLDNPYLNRFILGVRQRTGQRIVGKKGASGTVDQVLAEHGVVAFIADQDAGPKGLFVDFFGRPASTHKSIALLARLYDTPVAVTYARRLGQDYRFEVGVRRIIHPHEWADREDPVRWLTQTFTSELESVVRGQPDQYLWAHRRWKHRPGGGRAPGLGVA